MTTETASLTAMALVLAGAKKPCPERSSKSLQMRYEEPCETCKETPGEVYILPKETRVECGQIHTKIVHDNPTPNVSTTTITNGSCAEAGCRGWTPLDPMLLGRWMVAVRKARPNSGVYTRGDNEWHADVFDRGPDCGDSTADTPEEAFFQAAILALGL